MTVTIAQPGLVWLKDPVNRKTGKPTGMAPVMRHHEDCMHFERAKDGSLLGPAPYKATDEQMATIPPCRTCSDTSGSGAPRPRVAADRIGAPCSRCGMTLPLSRVCDNCA